MKLRTILLGKWSWKRPLYSLASIYLLLAAFAYFFADLIIFQPPPPSYGEDLNQLRFIPDGRGGRIALIYDPPSPGQPTLLWSHGNAEDLGNIQPILNTLEDLGYGLLAYDYPGYGLSDGKPSEESVYRAAE
ncbi:MAG: alpha/beta hydrolase, partial [Verrucomicrobiales bacterium]